MGKNMRTSCPWQQPLKLKLLYSYGGKSKNLLRRNVQVKEQSKPESISEKMSDCSDSSLVSLSDSKIELRVRFMAGRILQMGELQKFCLLKVTVMQIANILRLLCHQPLHKTNIHLKLIANLQILHLPKAKLRLSSHCISQSLRSLLVLWPKTSVKTVSF